jgi:hypothetical protein
MRKVLGVALLVALLPLGAARASLQAQDDAGSGGDAPDAASPSFRIEPGRVYTGSVDGQYAAILGVDAADPADWYAFEAPAATTLEALSASAFGCIGLADPAGVQLAYACSGGYEAPARAETVTTVAGTYHVFLDALQPDSYRFSVGVGGPAVRPDPVDPGAVLPVPLPAPDPYPAVSPATESDEHTVIAVVDSGVNLYHDFFAAPALTDHPSTWLSGFPASATPVSLSLGTPDRASAVAADSATLAGLTRSTYDPTMGTFDEHLYTFPGTRVVGGISFGEYDSTATPGPGLPVLDDVGRGTTAAGLAAGAGLAAADGNVLVVAVEVSDLHHDDGVLWAARQPWIDAIAVGYSYLADVPITLGPVGDRRGMEWATYEAHQHGKPVFMASGFGAPAPGATCTTYTSHFAGPSWVTRIGEAPDGPDALADPFDRSHCGPVDAVARVDAAVPAHDSLDTTAAPQDPEDSAAPNAAGHYGALLLAARRAGSTVSRTSALDHLLHAASWPSATAATLAEHGYGLVAGAAVRDAAADLAAGTGPRPRPGEDVWFTRDKAVRDAIWGPGGGAMAGPDLSVALAHDDAGSGRDAPDTRADDVRVLPGRAYDATLAGGSDTVDWYVFDGTAGDALRVAQRRTVGCVQLVDPTGAAFGPPGCTEGLTSTTPGGETAPVVAATLPVTGTWYLRFDSYYAPAPYRFAFTVDGSAPPPLLP